MSHITDSGQLLCSHYMAAGHGATVIPGKHVITLASKNKAFRLFYLRFVNMISRLIRMRVVENKSADQAGSAVILLPAM